MPIIREKQDVSLRIANIVQHVPKCMSCHKATVVITGRAHCFRDCIFIYIDLYIVMYLFHAFILQSVASFQKAFDEYKFRREIYQKNY